MLTNTCQDCLNKKDHIRTENCVSTSVIGCRNFCQFCNFVYFTKKVDGKFVKTNCPNCGNF